MWSALHMARKRLTVNTGLAESVTDVPKWLD